MSEHTAEKGRHIVALDRNCGGCRGEGSHRRWCRYTVGLAASIYGPMSEELERMGDTVGPNNHDLANRLWALSGDMRKWAKSRIVTSAQTSDAKETR